MNQKPGSDECQNKEEIYYRFYNGEMDKRTLYVMERELRGALERSELMAFYQPQVNIRTGKVVGVEALIRWKHPEWGMVAPDETIRLAEETGLIYPVGEWMLKTACVQNKTWQDQGYEPMVMSVNLSPCQFEQNDIIQVIMNTLQETGLASQYVDLEITESMTMNADRTITTLQELKTLGVHISMDDFGKGYGSLSYLKRFPIDTLKIDQSFISECTVDASDATIVKTIISMAHNLGLNVIAEGVETREQLVFLQQHLCDEAQGYLFSRPVSAEELELRFSELSNKLNQYGMIEFTEKAWMEEQLRVARQDLEDTVRQQQGMTFKIKKKGGRFIHTLCDGELLYRLGFVPQQIIGKELFDFLPEDQAVRKTRHYSRAWEGEDVTYESELNGIWYIASLRPIRRGGKAVELIASCVDITERKRTEEELKATKDQLESFIDNNSDAIWIVDLQRKVLRVNQAFENMFGWTSNELVGQTIPYIPDGFENELCFVIDLLHKGEVINNYETVRLRKDGSVIDVNMTVSPVRDSKGIIIAVAGVMRDISERKTAEAAIKKANEKYRLIADNMSDLIVVLDVGGRVRYASPSHETVLGIAAVHIEGESMFDMVLSDDKPRIEQAFAEMMRTKSPAITEYRFKVESGKWIAIEAKGTPILGEDGKVGSILVVSRDISERKQAEELLRKSKILNAVGELAAGVAHEIRNPLTVIKGFVQLLRSEKIKAEYFETIFSEFKSLESKINQFLMLAKPQTSEHEPADLEWLLQEVLLILEGQAVLNNVRIITDYDIRLPQIFGDKNHLKQMFVYLVKNAVESMPQDGRVLVQTKLLDKRQIKISIIDHGCGISEERLKRLGEPFYSNNEKGTGLGLTICHKIVREHGGSIQIFSEESKGTTVEVTLPCEL